MIEKLSKQDQDFVKEVALTGNQTQSAKNAYGIENDGSARVKGHKQLTKINIATAVEEVKKSLAERIPDELLERVHLEGLEASKEVWKNNNESGEIEKVSEEPDYAVRHKYLDSAYKLKGAYAPEKSVNLNIEANIADPRSQELAQEYEEKLKQGL